MSIEVSSLTKYYGSQKAINDVSFSVSEGEIVGLLGPNGAGKSTTMKIITGYLSASEGNVQIFGHDIKEETRLCQSMIGYLPEHNPLYKTMYVKEYLKFVCKIHGLSDASKRISEVIEMIGLAREQHKTIGSLSKGYRQRVGLAQAIIHDPKVLILDEPISGLDPNQILEMRKLIKSLGENRIVVFSSHIMQEVEALCDRLVILNQGQLVLDDTMEQAKGRGGSGRNLKITLEQAPDEAFISALRAICDVNPSGHVLLLTSAVDQDIKAQVFDLTVQHKNRIFSMSEEQYDMEAIFQKLTKSKVDA